MSSSLREGQGFQTPCWTAPLLTQRRGRSTAGGRTLLKGKTRPQRRVLRNERGEIRLIASIASDRVVKLASDRTVKRRAGECGEISPIASDRAVKRRVILRRWLGQRRER